MWPPADAGKNRSWSAIVIGEWAKPEGRIHFVVDFTTMKTGWVEGAIESGLRAARNRPGGEAGSRTWPAAGTHGLGEDPKSVTAWHRGTAG